MKLKIINPDFGMTPQEMDERCQLLQSAAGPDVFLSMDCLSSSRVYLDSMLDAVLAGPEIVSMAMKAQSQGYDAVILYCFSDPAVEACREALEIPVIGGGQAACLSALTVCRQFGVIVSQPQRIPEKRQFFYQTGIHPDRVCGLEAVDLMGRPARENIDFTVERLSIAARTLIARDGAQAIVLGCLSFLGMDNPLSQKLGVPVIDAAAASVAIAAACVRMNLSTSSASYPMPPKGDRTWDGGNISLR